MHKSQGLCIRCGLCCKGAIFNRVDLRENENAHSFERSGFDLLLDEKGYYFLQPCTLHREGRCIVYEAGCPSICRDFQCRLLRRCLRGRIEWDEAAGIAKKANEMLSKIIESSGDTERLQGFVGVVKYVNQNFTSMSFRKNNAQLILEIMYLRKYIERHFWEKLPA